jgi:hypothetical protein
MFAPVFIKESILHKEVKGWEATIFSQKGFQIKIPLKLGMPQLLDKLSNLIKNRQYVNIKT